MFWGTITVNTNVTGASIKVVSNGSVVATEVATTTSTAIKGVKTGTYTVLVEKEGYVSVSKEITVNNIDITINAELEVKKLEVTSVIATNGTKEVTLPGTNVAANSSVEIHFNGEVKSSSIITGNVTLTKNGVKQLVDVTYNTAKKAAVLKLKNNATFEAGATYILTVNSVESTTGLEMKAYMTTFTVSNNPIVKTASYVSSAYGDPKSYTDLDGAVVDGNTDASDDSNEEIKLTFNKEMSKSTIVDANIKVLDKTDNKYLDKTLLNITTADGVTKVDVKVEGLRSNHDYELVIENASSLDGAVMEPQSFKFFYGITAPTLQHVAANNISSGSFSVGSVYGYLTPYGGYSAFTFKAQLTGDVDAGTVTTNTVVLKEKASGEVVTANVSYEAGSRYIIVTPSEDLKEETAYEIVFDGIKTEKGLKVAKNTYTFTTGDYAAPTVTSVAPANGADKVSVSEDIVITFSEGMDASSLTAHISLKDLTSDTTLQIATYYSPVLSPDGKTYTLTSIKDLEVGHSYELTIEGNGFNSGVKDDATVGNYLTNDYVVKFATVDATTTYLKDVKNNNFNENGKKIMTGATSVANNADFYFTFDKALNVGDNSTTVTVAAKSGSTWTEKSLNSDFTIDKTQNSNKTIKIAPYSTWDADTTYKITITNLKDVNGNDVADQTFQFTVGTKPEFVISDPTGFALDVSLNTSYVYAVIEDTDSDLDASTLTSANVKFVKKSNQSVAPYTFVTAQYKKETAMCSSVTITANNKFIVGSENIAKKFKKNQLIKLDGTNIQYAVVTDIDITSKEITVDRTLSADSSVDIIPAQGVVYMLKEDAKLEGNTQYQLIISGIKDVAGNEMDAKTETFTTAADVKALEFISSSIKDGDTGVAVNAKVELKFNEELSALNVISINDVTDSDTVVTDKFNIVQENGVVTISPKGFWKSANQYKIVVNGNATSSENTVLGEDKVITFQTEQKASVLPKIEKAQYIDGGTAGISVDDNIVLTLNAPAELYNKNLASEYNIYIDGEALTSDDIEVVSRNNGSTLVLTLKNAITGFIPNTSKIAIKKEQNSTLSDIIGNNFTEDEVVVEK